MPLSLDLDEDLVDVEGDTVAAMTSLESPGISCSKLDVPNTDSLAADDDASLCQKIFDVTVTQIESVVEPDSVRDHIWRELVAFIGFNVPILVEIGDLTWQYPDRRII